MLGLTLLPPNLPKSRAFAVMLRVVEGMSQAIQFVDLPKRSLCYVRLGKRTAVAAAVHGYCVQSEVLALDDPDVEPRVNSGR